MIFAMRRYHNNGRRANVVVYLEADSKEQAFSAFGAGRYWSGYSENNGFAAEEVAEIPKKAVLLNAAGVIAANPEY